MANLTFWRGDCWLQYVVSRKHEVYLFVSIVLLLSESLGSWVRIKMIGGRIDAGPMIQHPTKKQSQHPQILMDLLKVIVDPFYHGIPNSSPLNHLQQIMVGKCLVNLLELNSRTSNFLGLSRRHQKLPEGYALSWCGVIIQMMKHWPKTWLTCLDEMIITLFFDIFCKSCHSKSFLYHFFGGSI